MPPYTVDTREGWESALLEAVKRYTVGVWTAAGQPRDVMISVDGVVPMAKIKQQRLRRFKSVWLAGQEVELGAAQGPKWDTNAITPGTEFMEKLGVALGGLCEKRGWVLSGADQAGEGEQKIMAEVRRRGSLLDGKKVLVYGLDADLIVLSLLTMARSAPGIAEWGLLREEIDGSKDGFGVLNIKELSGILVPPEMTAAEYLLEYTCAMSFLGNDFLPHSLSVKLRDNGHDTMCYRLTDIHRAGQRLVSPEGVLNREVAATFLEPWASFEEGWIAEAFQHKYKMRSFPARNEYEKAMAPLEALPLEWAAEAAIWRRYPQGQGLLEGWRETYRRVYLKEADTEAVAAAYSVGLQWILDYYLGKPISYAWYFPWSVPPTWADIVAGLRAAREKVPASHQPPVAPQEQLAMVLPMASWGLIRDPRLRTLPSKAPYMWPTSFGFFSAGRRWMWECEAEIPVMSMERLKALLTPQPH